MSCYRVKKVWQHLSANKDTEKSNVVSFAAFKAKKFTPALAAAAA
jgi:hypothetical protein